MSKQWHILVDTFILRYVDYPNAKSSLQNGTLSRDERIDESLDLNDLSRDTSKWNSDEHLKVSI